ncbi:hypothetical protein RvY_11041 [Ramazzottius varieornatus]|uniref:Uncharacterized protein n=1 Tax=Ramazzottius varieornatus TaxID=947166 RepID=A0A1D1VJ77_RAMVA|nr:hypothetical protein RvY_11041 [Ramazzottius varieornatus]
MGIPLSGILMLQFRIVETHEKSMDNAVTTVVTSGLGMLPAPIVAGKLIDGACLLWQRSPCGHHGACWIYDMDLFRFRLHALVGLARFVSVLRELAVSNHVTCTATLMGCRCSDQLRQYPAPASLRFPLTPKTVRRKFKSSLMF